MRLFGGANSSQNSANFDDLGVGLKPLTPAQPATAPAAPTAPVAPNTAPVAPNTAPVTAPASAPNCGDALAFERERWEDEKARYERQRLDNEFNDALNRLADIQNPFMRAGGANHVAAMARRRVLETGDIDDTHPYFVRAAAHLAAALHLEEESAVRDEVQKALDQMTDYARFEGEEGQFLLYSLLDDLAAANRSARKAFVAALARHLARTAINENQAATNFDALRPLVDFTNFCGREEDTFRCLCDLADSPDCRTQTRFQAAVGLAQALRKSVSSATQSTDALDVVYRAAERLKETTSALTLCLRALTAIPDDVLEGGEIRLGMWRRAGRRLNLAGTFLAGARLAGAHLAGANLMDAVMHGTELDGTNLVGANLYSANLGGANLFNVILSADGNPGVPQNAPNASLSGADWWRANPLSWRGTKGEMLKKWLQGRFPVTEEGNNVPHWNDAPVAATAPAVAAPAETPVAAARAGRATGGRSVRALFGGPAAPAASGAPNAAKDAEVVGENEEEGTPSTDIENVSLDAVRVQASGKPQYGDKFHKNDFSAVQDLMTDRADDDLSGVSEGSVRVQDSGNPSDLRYNPRINPRDLGAVKDLMKGR